MAATGKIAPENDAASQPPVDEPSQEAAAAAPSLDAQRIAALEARVAELQDQTRHYAQSYDKARSEFAAARERMQREHERTVRRDQAKVVGGLLTVLDSLDRSLTSVQAAGPGQAFVDGVQMIRTQFEAALATLGLQRFDGMGERFDPERHQAVTSVPVTDPTQDGRVIQSLSAGAVIGDEVVRAATVVVGQLLRQPEPPQDLN